MQDNALSNAISRLRISVQNNSSDVHDLNTIISELERAQRAQTAIEEWAHKNDIKITENSEPDDLIVNILAHEGNKLLDPAQSDGAAELAKIGDNPDLRDTLIKACVWATDFGAWTADFCLAQPLHPVEGLVWAVDRSTRGIYRAKIDRFDEKLQCWFATPLESCPPEALGGCPYRVDTDCYGELDAALKETNRVRKDLAMGKTDV